MWGLHMDSYLHEQTPFEVVLLLSFATRHVLWGSSYNEASLVGLLQAQNLWCAICHAWMVNDQGVS